MKLTKLQLKRIIKEELQKVLNDGLGAAAALASRKIKKRGEKVTKYDKMSCEDLREFRHHNNDAKAAWNRKCNPVQEGVFSSIGDLAAGFGEGFLEKELNTLKYQDMIKNPESVPLDPREAFKAAWNSAIGLLKPKYPEAAQELSKAIGEEEPTEEQEEEKTP